MPSTSIRVHAAFVGVMRARSVGVVVALTCAVPVSALAAEPASLSILEASWHGCVRAAYDRQPERASRAGRERSALDACKARENAYVAALMATRPEDGDEPLHGWARTWAAYVAYVVDPVTAWIGMLKR